MKLPNNNKSTLSTITSISIIWISPSILFYLFSYTNLRGLFSSQTSSFLVIVFFVFLLSSTMATFLRYDEFYLCKNNIIRRNILILLIILRLLFFQIERAGSFVGIVAGIAGTTTLILFACLLGSYLSQAIKRLPELVPVCSVAFTVDLYSVLSGPSKEIAQEVGKFYGAGAKGTIPYVDMILIKIPNPTINYLTPIFGVSDWIFVVFFTSTLLKFGISDSLFGKGIARTVAPKSIHIYFPLISIALLASILLAYTSHLFVPALPIMIMIALPWVIIKQPNLFKMKSSDFYLTLIAPVLATMAYFYKS